MMVKDIDEFGLKSSIPTVNVENEAVRTVFDLICAALHVGAECRNAAIGRLDHGEGESLERRRQYVQIEEGIDLLWFASIAEEVDAIGATAYLRRSP